MSSKNRFFLPVFGVMIDAYLHSKVAANRSEGRNQQQKKNGGEQKISETEKKC